MMADIMATFRLDAHGFGSLSAIATFCYAILQIPAGILSDLFGARRMVLISMFLCMSGVTLFGYTDHIYIAYLSRIMIGSGSACAFLCVSKISSDWFPKDKKSLLFALTVTVGTCGALIGGAPLSAMNAHFGWRGSFYILAILGGIILLFNFLFLRDRNTTKYRQTPPSRKETWEAIKNVFRSRFCWMYAIVAIGIYLTTSVFADLWGVPFMILKYDLSREAAAQAVSMIYIGMCFGVISIAWLGRFFKDPRPIIGGAALIIAALFSLIVFGNIQSTKGIYCILFAIGFISGAEVLCFTCACEAMSISVAATITGFINFIVTLGTAIVQKQIGYILHVLSKGKIGENGLPFYILQDYQEAMSLLVVLILLSFGLSFFLDKAPKSPVVCRF
jgi:MFS family permease